MKEEVSFMSSPLRSRHFSVVSRVSVERSVVEVFQLACLSLEVCCCFWVEIVQIFLQTRVDFVEVFFVNHSVMVFVEIFKAGLFLLTAELDSVSEGECECEGNKVLNHL